MEVYELVNKLREDMISLINQSGLPLETSESVLYGVIGEVRLSEREQVIKRLKQQKEGEQ